MSIRLASLIERARSRKPVTALSLAGVLLLPALLGGVLATALQDPTGRLDRMTAAIVNEDRPVTVNGRLAPLGRQLAAGLVTGNGRKSENLTWVVSNAKDAAAGLTDGSYQAVVRIPKGFSAAATSGATTIQNPTAAAKRATISVTTAAQARAVDRLIANEIADTAATRMGTTISKNTLQNVLVGFRTLGDKIGQAADGADQLTNGAKTASTSAAALPDAATRLGDGAAQLAAGATQLSTGLNTIAAGITSAQTGANQTGAQLSQGADALQANGIVPPELAQGAKGAATASSSVSQGVGKLADTLTKLSAQCTPTTQAELCTALAAAAAQANDQLVPGAATAATAAQGTASGLSAFNTTAASTLSAQFRAAADGINRLSAGLGGLADGTTQSATGAGNLGTGATGLQSGASQLANGATRLRDGLGTLANGTSGLASGLREAAAAVPQRTTEQTSSLAEVVSRPVAAVTSGGMFGATGIPLLTAIALWFGGLISFLVMRALPAGALTSRRTSAALALRALAPAMVIGAAQGLLLALVVEPVARYDPARWAGFAGVAMLTGVAFAALNQALVAVLGGVGRWVSALVGVAALGAGIVSTVPGWLAAIAAVLPTSPAMTALLGARGTGGAIVALLAWATLAVVASALAVAMRRTGSTRLMLAPAR